MQILSLRHVPVVILAALTSACATLGGLQGLIQPPRFSESPDRRAEIRLIGPTAGAPLGGAAVRLWARVENPNSFGFTLSTLRGTLFLEESRAATADLPLGLPLAARADSEFPIDFTVSFADLPGLGDALRRAISREPIAYRFDGTVGVDAGRFGSPEFGPLTLLRGEIRGDRTVLFR
jgi:hypothetical protein